MTKAKIVYCSMLLLKKIMMMMMVMMVIILLMMLTNTSSASTRYNIHCIVNIKYFQIQQPNEYFTGNFKNES